MTTTLFVIIISISLMKTEKRGNLEDIRDESRSEVVQDFQSRIAEEVVDEKEREKYGNRNYYLSTGGLVFIAIIVLLKGFKLFGFELSDFILNRLIWLVGGVIVLQKMTTGYFFRRSNKKKSN